MQMKFTLIALQWQGWMILLLNQESLLRLQSTIDTYCHGTSKMAFEKITVTMYVYALNVHTLLTQPSTK